MSKGIIKEKKPQKLSRWEVIKAWIAESIASIKRSLKDGGWKGTMLALSSTVATFATVLTACVNEPDVKIETITDKEKVESLVSENFSVENAVKDEMQKQFGKLENFTFENGVAKAVVTKDGEKYNAEVAINVDANDFKVEKYNNAEVANDGSLHFYLDGKLTSEKVDGIVVEVGKDIYVVDPTDFYIGISMAVSDASLHKVETEKPDPEEPENPGDPTDPENPDPEEPENPGGEDKPDPDEPENPDPEEPENPENPTDPENPDPDEPENPGGEDKPDPGEPENPGGEDKPDPENPGEGEEGKPDEGGEGEPDPEEPTEITFDSWEELMNIENSAYYDDILEKMSEIVKREMVNTYFVQGVVGNISGRPATTLENTDTLRIGYNFNENGEIKEIIWTGVKYGHSSDTDAGIVYATVPMVTPISSDVVKVYTNSSENINNDSVVCGSNIIDLSGITGKIRYNEKSIKVQSRYGDRQLTEEKQQYFDLCMQLAVNADAIGENAKLAFVTVQGRSATNEKWGTTYNIAIKVFDIQTNELYSFTFIFDDDKQADNMIDRIKSAISRQQYEIYNAEKEKVITADVVFEFNDALGNVVTYTTPQESENQA